MKALGNLFVRDAGLKIVALLIALLVWPTSLSADSAQSGAAAFGGQANRKA